MGTIASNALRNGSVFELDDRKYVVLKYQHIKKGRGQATIRLKVRDIENGVITEKTFTNEQSVQEADVAKQSAQFLYADDSNAYFMSNEDFSQFELPVEQIQDELLFMIEGSKVITLYIDGIPVSIELPKTVDLKIQTTDPAVAGNTAQNALKNAVMETGLQIKVPLFLKEGEIIKINTQTYEYLGRV
ncbi:MAG: elongation factor P [Candidatus Dojkabacteria bacterium]|uniref:Elongation factor P n=1 Tax=Candidatus Dojkabacteria bacterium TaxID=2099670 RepID=A0A952AKV1_9BACT|nr:elongation factor P [Candidatus Dojkabacteria bacterium]WKZ28362.1 MAG: elongation factor P [Candidatus Dojkabacteria bacterium]